MDFDFIKRLQKISLIEEEEGVIAVQGDHRKQILDECSLSLMGRFLSEKPLNLRAVKNTSRSVRKFGSDLKIVEVGDDLLQFKFSLDSQLKWVLDNGLWCFDDHLLVLRRWEKGMTAINVTFPKIQFWVQIWGLPFNLMNEEAGKEIGGSLGEVVDVDAKAILSKQARFLYIRVDLPLDKPLRRGAPMISPKGDKSWVAFKYERIVGLCYWCGCLGHKVKTCPLQSSAKGDTEVANVPYGNWLRAGGL